MGKPFDRGINGAQRFTAEMRVRFAKQHDARIAQEMPSQADDLPLAAGRMPGKTMIIVYAL